MFTLKTILSLAEEKKKQQQQRKTGKKKHFVRFHDNSIDFATEKLTLEFELWSFFDYDKLSCEMICQVYLSPMKNL